MGKAKKARRERGNVAKLDLGKAAREEGEAPESAPAEPSPSTREPNPPARITPEQIAEIPRRYAIGKRPLSKLLGWGELTYTRLLDGCTPNQEHANELRHLLEEPAAFARLLERGRAQGVITDVAYRRSRNALDDILSEQSPDSMVMFEIADRLCVLAEGELTPHALQALVYLVQGWSTAHLGDPLFSSQPTAAAYGPEYRPIREAYSFASIQETFTRSRGSGAGSAGAVGAQSDSQADAGQLHAQCMAEVDFVFQKYGDLSGSALCRETRSQAPWRKARKRADAPEGADCDELITIKSMKKFFAH